MTPTTYPHLASKLIINVGTMHAQKVPSLLYTDNIYMFYIKKRVIIVKNPPLTEQWHAMKMNCIRTLLRHCNCISHSKGSHLVCSLHLLRQGSEFNTLLASLQRRLALIWSQGKYVNHRVVCLFVLSSLCCVITN